MSLLGFDTSTAACSACVLRDDGAAFEVAPAPARLAAPPAHAAELLPAVHDAMERAGLSLADLEAIAVGVGPGGFTGLRIGVTTGRALARAAGLGLRPVSSPLALAAGIDAELRLAVLDAKRGEVFAALASAERTLWPPFRSMPEALAARVREAGQDPLAAGDGSIRFRETLEAANIRVAPSDSGAHVVQARQVCALAQDVPDTPPEAVLPDYLRDPDAKPQ